MMYKKIAIVCINILILFGFAPTSKGQDMKNGSMMILEAMGGIVRTPELARNLAITFFEAEESRIEQVGEPSVTETETSWIVEIETTKRLFPGPSGDDGLVFLIEIKKSDARVVDLKLYPKP